MKAVQFKCVIEKFGTEMGEKSGWYYVLIPSKFSEQLFPERRKSYRVKGSVSRHPILITALLPDGSGEFIMPLNQQIRKAIQKQTGDEVQLRLEVDHSEYPLNTDLIACLEDDPDAGGHFYSLTPSHRNYFSKWIDNAKTDATKEKRIAMAINALSRKMGFPEMLREQKKDM